MSVDLPSPGRITVVITTIDDEGSTVEVKLEDVDPEKFLTTGAQEALNALLSGWRFLSSDDGVS
jgi:hypothetical protein